MKASMAKTITLEANEYRRLKTNAERYEAIRQLVAEDFFTSPPTKNRDKIIQEFRKTGLYPKTFLKSLGRGLRESAYFSSRR